MQRRTIAAFITLVTLVALVPIAASAQAPPPRVEVLVLGTYHMANPGRDVFNTEADDVLSPKRQAEIRELTEVLSRFRPTKVAVEASFNSSAVARRYEAYLVDEHELTRNETEQIGFRLARQLGHATVYPVDVDGEFPLLRLQDYATANGLEAEFQTLMDRVGARVEEESEYLRSHTVLEALLRMNSEESVRQDVGSYYQFVRFGKPWNWAGADLLASWFHRNVRIFSNIVDLAESPGERVLVVYGAGHLGWLRDMVAADPTLRLRKLAELTPGG